MRPDDREELRAHALGVKLDEAIAEPVHVRGDAKWPPAPLIGYGCDLDPEPDGVPMAFGPPEECEPLFEGQVQVNWDLLMQCLFLMLVAIAVEWPRIHAAMVAFDGGTN